ncbi:SIS domain-containing protein [Rugosimonospora africana]|uniref:Glucosamine--fructose-6-phosphate aminotransferase (Isomerizing) n=1 Tax=Rugosimonospora africana TaxID=556532 RepID=A0A8J3QT20_9ACTN|nr:SIS domain-containing protein [Rugosimonospora africana]GIH15929.1 hypothetical protein Raf01_41010 [Rugosimonospora africana]
MSATAPRGAGTAESTGAVVRGYITYASARHSQADTLERVIASVRAQVSARQAAGEFTGPGPIFVGIGNSFAAACAPVWALRGRGIHSWRLASGDYPVPFPDSAHPIIGISQSGRSPETLAVLAGAAGRPRYAVVNNDPSPMTAVLQDVVGLGNIADSYASTIGFTATVAALGLIADAWDGGAVDPAWDELPAHFRALERRLDEQLPEMAAALVGAGYADFVGAGPSLGSAECGALLLREVARVPATPMSTRQYLHGAMESAGGGVHVLLGDERELDLADTLAGAGHPVILVTGAQRVPDRPGVGVVRLPRVPVAPRAILEALVMQALAGEAADRRGITIEEFVFHNSDTKVAPEAGTPA